MEKAITPMRIGALRQHHRNTPLKNLIKENFPLQYKRIMGVKGVPFEYKLFTFYANEDTHCPECRSLRRLVKPLRAEPTCGKRECQEQNRITKMRAGKVRDKEARTANARSLLPKRPTEVDLTRAAKANIGGSTKFFDILKDTYPRQMSKLAKLVDDVSQLQLKYFLCEGRLPTCIDCGSVLRNPASQRCKGTCASRQAMADTRASGRLLGNADATTKARMQATMLARYGVKGSMANPNLLLKHKATLKRNHGVETAAHIPAVREAHTKRYEDKEWVRKITNKTQETMRQRYGKYWRQVVADQLSSARYKRHVLELNGVSFRVQGYEPYVLRLLNSKGINGKHIKVYGRTFEDYDTGRMYRPDIIVKRKGLIIEVKSTYTAGLHKNGTQMWKQLVANSRLVASEGESLTLIIVQPKTGYVAIKDPHKLTRTQARRLIKQPKAFPWSD